MTHMRINLTTLNKMAQDGDKITMLTCYDASFAAVCGHRGLTPQSVNTLGGYRIQGKTDAAAQRLIDEAKMVQEAGAAMLVLELMPSAVGRAVTAALRIPTIGIGAGVDCAGQVLV